MSLSEKAAHIFLVPLALPFTADSEISGHQQLSGHWQKLDGCKSSLGLRPQQLSPLSVCNHQAWPCVHFWRGTTQELIWPCLKKLHHNFHQAVKACPERLSSLANSDLKWTENWEKSYFSHWIVSKTQSTRVPKNLKIRQNSASTVLVCIAC